MAVKGLENKLRKLKAITRVLRCAGSPLELEFFARVSVRELINIVGCDACAVIYVEGGKATILAERKFSERYGRTAFSSDNLVIKHVLETKRTLFTTDLRSCTIAGCLPDECGTNSLICTPLVVDDGVVIIVYLDSAKKNAFGEEDIELVKILALEISEAFKRTRAMDQAELQNAFIVDKATGCFNRRKFDMDVITEINEAQEYGRPLSLLMINIRWSQKVGDGNERCQGRVPIRKLASTLIDNIRPYDKVYRYSKETFAVLLTDTDRNGALSAADRLKRLIGKETVQKINMGAQAFGIEDLDMGVASFPSDATCSTELVQSAQSELYRLEIQSAIHEIGKRTP